MWLKKRSLLIPLVFIISITACKKWQDHIEVGNPDLKQDLLQAIASNSDLSKFKEYISKTGLDTLLQSSKTFTVWAPSNTALSTLDPAIVNDNVRLRSFLLNHISNQSYFTRDAQTMLRVPVLNGKYNNFLANKFDDANITSADRFVKNGVLHVIDKSIPVLQSIWDYINATTAQYTQNAFIAGLNFNAFDPSLATIDSISSTTGLPVYKPGTGIVVKNKFNEQVYNVKDESKQFTYFVIANAGFTLESDSLKIYFATGNTTSTDSLAKWNTVKDLIVSGAYPSTALTGLVSRSGVSIPINPSQIIETRKLSNGIVYVLSNVNVRTVDKFKQLTIQGENPSGFLIDRTANTNYRVRLNPVTNQNFNDILVTGHGVTTFYSYYRLNEMPSMKYRVFGFGVNDFQTGALTQNIVPKYLSPAGVYSTLATLLHTVPLNTAAGAYNELLIGEFTSTNYGTLEIQLTGVTTGPIVLDYLRIVPLP
jgi:Fasciclin domain